MFNDAYAVVHGDAGQENTFGMTYPEWGVKKIDYVLFRQADRLNSEESSGDVALDPVLIKPVEACLLGNEPILDKVHPGGRDGKLYPSDHLGVLVRFEGL